MGTTLRTQVESNMTVLAVIHQIHAHVFAPPHAHTNTKECLSSKLLFLQRTARSIILAAYHHSKHKHTSFCLVGYSDHFVVNGLYEAGKKDIDRAEAGTTFRGKKKKTKKDSLKLR
uniref:Uncharacterized protein n=1 Tax=Trypanosoma congolense (strain IL3000) TaxID=1068625 RepID=G0UQ21_TRYCI|nr:hypothetical protein, unlikely [Trypanosoma congolense IL3000]